MAALARGNGEGGSHLPASVFFAWGEAVQRPEFVHQLIAGDVLLGVTKRLFQDLTNRF